MKINIGRGVLSRNLYLSPSNVGMKDIAQRRLDHTIDLANRRHIEAVQVDGVNAWVFNKTGNGERCTCHYKSNIEKNIPGQTSNESPENFVFELPGSDGFFSDEDLISEDEINTKDQLDFLTEGNGFNPNDIDQEILKLLGDENIDYSGLAGGLNTPCAICYRTGKNHSYQPFRGQRIVLDATESLSRKENGWIINKEKKPYVFSSECDPANSVEWQVLLPIYFKKCHIRLRNNVSLTENLIVEFNEPNSTEWFSLTENSLMLRNGLDNRLNIRVRPKTENLEQIIEFTHVEFMFEFTKPFIIQVPQITLDQNYQYIKPVIQSNFELTAEIQELGQESVIIESKYNEAWRVSSIDQKLTAKNKLFSFEVGVRVIHNHELFYLLHQYRRPRIILNYSGIAVKQR